MGNGPTQPIQEPNLARYERIAREARIGRQVAEIGAVAERIEVTFLGGEGREERLVSLDRPPQVFHRPGPELLAVVGRGSIIQCRHHGAATGHVV